jgi:murein tripeptide amidase MpaA
MYLTVPELEAALPALNAAYPSISELITPPHPTHEGRTSPLLRIGVQTATAADGVVILGGVHAREWIPPDLCVSFAADLLEAYTDGTGLGYGGASYTAAEVKRLLETVNVYVYACVNPDGRAFSQSTDGNWRKNRRPAPSGGGASCVGVDLNRNFDFLWDHTAKFAADAGVRTSADPCDYQVYRGPSPASEPETQNVVWVLDTYPRIRWMVDVHSAVPVVLHSWGSDTNQSTTPGENFANPALDAVRGRLGDGIGEFLLDQHQTVATGLASRLRDGVLAVRGVDYPVEQAMTLYPTSGASDDYAFSRHFADPVRPLVLGWCVECGTSFQPPYREAEEVIKETSSGLLRFALSLHELTESLHALTDGLAVLRTPSPERVQGAS